MPTPSGWNQAPPWPRRGGMPGPRSPLPDEREKRAPVAANALPLWRYLEQQSVYGTNENIPRPCLRIRDERLRAVELPESLADKKPHRRSVPQPLRLGRAARHDGGRQALVYWAGISSNRNAALVDS